MTKRIKEKRQYASNAYYTIIAQSSKT